MNSALSTLTRRAAASAVFVFMAWTPVSVAQSDNQSDTQPATQPAAQTTESLLAAHVTALGGRAAIERIESLQRSGRLTFESEFTGSLSGTLDQTLVLGSKVYNSSQLGVFSTTTAWDGTTGWERTAQGQRVLAGAELQQLQAQSDWFFSTGLGSSELTSVERLDDHEIDGVAHYALRYQGPILGDITAYLDPQTHLISQTIQTVEIPGIGQVVAVTDSWDYTAIDGVLIPRKISVALEGLFASQIEFESTLVNGAIDATLFELPVLPDPVN
ncbi:MAG: hypothetical protein K8J08_15695 [Thermoanaerobaculia bacterium]|nr:hypothetical protein [Thermoanaerobaculia bacterium]